MFCPLHKYPAITGLGEKCTACERLGLIVVQCEIDKISRSMDTIIEQGYECDFRQSNAVLVFRKEQSNES